MLKKKFCQAAALLLSAVLLGALPACKKDDGTGKLFAYPIDAIPVYLDPAIAESADELLVVGNCFEGLVRLDSNGKVAPGAAKSWAVSADGLTYTFQLRHGARWKLLKNKSSGTVNEMLGSKEATEAFDTRLIADDFVFGLRRALSPATKTPGAQTLYAIENARAVHEGTAPASALGVRAMGDDTLEIKLAAPNATFLYALTQSAAMPCSRAWFEAAHGRYGLAAKYLLCNGPFYVSRWDGNLLRMYRNDSYQGESPPAPLAVDLKVQPDATERLRLLGDGYDAALVPADAAPPPGANETEINNATLALVFQCERLPQANLRTALCAALDAKELGVSAPPGLLPGGVRVGGQPLSALAEPPQGIACDPARARKLLEDSGKRSLSLLCAPAHEQIMRRALQAWQSLFGLRLEVVLETPEPELLEKRLRAGDFDIAITTLRAGSSFALQALQELIFPGAANPMRYQSGAVEALLRGAAQTADPAETARACRQAEAHLLQNGVAYPLAAESSRFILAAGVEGVDVSPAGDLIFFWGAKKL
ncbi:MAG: peptide ABC transporter substrate-binding protein [Oscillospiraceae bacterium]|jgi:ABC-type oligopeptide transport system substrate-binding subunit|nr:peptide ABC transporter substrate-binding protein [Oscillospiraceae bacterium]